MKCEICHEADAAAVIHVKKDGEDRELYVCKACAAKSRHKKKDTKPKDKRAPDLEFGDGEEPPEFVKNLVEATLGFMKGVVESEQNSRTCPACKMTWEQAKESGHLGCPNCWKAFAKNIRANFLSGQYGPKHVGSMPPTVTGEASRAYLERELKKAIRLQKYEKAAEIQRRLDELVSDAPETDGKEPT